MARMTPMTRLTHLAALAASCTLLQSCASLHHAGQYPEARRSDHVDTYHGVAVADPYRWMEDIDAPETRTWVEAEGKSSRAFLDAIPGREAMTARLKRIWNYERWSSPEHHGQHWFYSHNDGLQNQPVVFVTDDPDKPGRVLVDPNTLSQDGTLALRETSVSDDGSLFAYAVSEAGSDWQIWHVRDVASGKDLADTLVWSKFGGATWRKDGSGFYYTAYDPPAPGTALKVLNEYQRLYFHKLGSAQKEDRLIYARTDEPGWFVASGISDDGHHLILTINKGTDVRNALLVQDLSEPDAPVVPVVAQPRAQFDPVEVLDNVLYARTDEDATRYRIVAFNLAAGANPPMRQVVGEGADTLEAARLIGGELLVGRFTDAHSLLERYALDGRRLGEVPLPGIGTASDIVGRPHDSQAYFHFAGFTTPPAIYRLDMQGNAVSVWHSPHLDGFDPAQYETREVFARSKDGTRVPIFIAARKGVRRDASNPTLLYGYGGFNIPLTPVFAPSIADWLVQGGIYAQAILRGGGEYGRAWHEAGMKLHKQNVFDDFIAAGEYLVAERWTEPAHLAIQGGSNGGLLVGAVEEQRPGLAAAVIAQVGVMDMLRFREFTVGRAWESDYGSVDHADEFKAMRAYSPYHNVRDGVDYPATLILTGDHDDRVFPAHSFKFAAAMQHADPDGHPLLLRVEMRAGHGQGMPTTKRIEEVVDEHLFILDAFGLAH